MHRRTCAVIITWNSGEEIYRSLPAISPQVEKVVIVDNGSRPDQLKILETAAARFPNAAILRNKKNFGIAQAMNRGAEFASENGFAWFITLDDAALPEPAMAEKLFAALDALPQGEREKTAILAPNYTTLKGPVFAEGSAYFVATTVQTGQAIRISTWKETGGFKEDLFITGVDHEFCLRILAAGYKTLLVPSAHLAETAGPNPVVRSLLGRKFVVPNYSPLRYYYTHRNNMYLYKTYWRLVPGWVGRNMIGDIKNFAKIILFESQKLEKTRMILRGIFDGLRNVYGELGTH